jgi:hypothetical protein
MVVGGTVVVVVDDVEEVVDDVVVAVAKWCCFASPLHAPVAISVTRRARTARCL